MIGTKLDLRRQQEMNDDVKKKEGSLISHDQGVKLAEEVGAITYIECCVWSKNDIQKLHETLSIIITDHYRKHKHKNCTLL